jgi:hypothetical protein
VILCRILFSIESAQWTFGVALLNSMLDMLQFDWIQSYSELRLCDVAQPRVARYVTFWYQSINKEEL